MKNGSDKVIPYHGTRPEEMRPFTAVQLGVCVLVIAAAIVGGVGDGLGGCEVVKL